MKWALIVMGFLLTLLVISGVGLLIYINYEGPKSEEQKKSFSLLDNMLKKAPKVMTATEEAMFAAEEVDFYDDLEEDGMSTVELELEMEENGED